MIHPDDLAILFREPRAATVMDWVIWLAIAGPIIFHAGRALWRRLRRRDAPLRPWLLGLGAVCLLLSAYGFQHGVNIRLVQAACWRAGPDAVSDGWKNYCRNIPPQGVDGLYHGGLFGERR